VGFILKRFELGSGDGAAAGEEFEPVAGLIQLFEAIADFGDELGFGA
jgi:hypothetical protein